MRLAKDSLHRWTGLGRGYSVDRFEGLWFGCLCTSRTGVVSLCCFYLCLSSHVPLFMQILNRSLD